MRRSLGFILSFLIGSGGFAADRIALVIENGPSSHGIAVEQIDTSLRQSDFSIRRAENVDKSGMEEAFKQFASQSPTNGTGIVVFVGDCVEIDQRKDSEVFKVPALLAVDGIKDEPKTHKNSLTFAKIADLMEKTLGTGELRFVLASKKFGEVREEDLLPGTTVSYLNSIAELDALLPKPGGEKWLDSETIREGEFAGQQWINELGMVFCWCPPGKFKMGDERFSDAAPVDVELSKGFWISKYETTQRDWYQLKKSDPVRDTPFLHPMAPAVLVKQHEILSHFKRHTEQLQEERVLPQNWGYHIPTEAEWEYACRAGNPQSKRQPIDQIANVADSSLFKVKPTAHWADATLNDGVGMRPAVVGSYQPNAWGIYDMLGNVAEWTADLYFPTLEGGIDPTTSGREKETQDRVFRGGSWVSKPEYCDPAFRNFTAVNGNSQSTDFLGFRIILKQTD